MKKTIQKIEKRLLKILIKKLRFALYLYSLLILFVFPIYGHCQSVIKGTIYLYDTKEPAIGCSVILTDSTKTDSIVRKQLKGTKIDAIVDLYGKFEIKNVTDEKTDLLLNFCGYRNTIVKNISLNIDTIEINELPLFISDNVIHATMVETKKHFWGLYKTTRWYGDIIGTEGPFTYNDRLYLKCDSIQDTVLFERKGNEIIVDYNKIKTCGNKRYKKLSVH